MREKKSRVLYVITKGTWGGAQRYVFDLATSLPRDTFDVEVILGGNGLLKEKLTVHNIKTVSIGELQRNISLSKEIRSFFFLYHLFRKQPRTDIVHLNSSKAGGIGALAARIAGVRRIVFTAHGWPFNEGRGRLWKKLAWIGSYLTALLSTDVIVIAKREYEQAKAMPGIGAKTHFIPNGVQMMRFLPREEARLKLGLPEEAFVIGSTGELTKNKNYADLLEASHQLWRKERKDFKLAIIGGGEDLAEMRTKVENDPMLRERTILPGFKEDAYQYLKAYDVFALPSRKEGLPYALLEAGLASLPVVATFVGGIPDIIENGVTGLLVPPGDLHSLVSALKKFLEEQRTRERLGKALGERVKSAFSFEHMLSETVMLYDRPSVTRS